MRYERIYAALIERSRGRNLSGYVEKHHILPVCLGGTDDSSNIVTLTAREHFVAHQLLVKINPGVPGLTFAAVMMRRRRVIGKYASRKYEWIRQRSASERSSSLKGKSRPAAHMQAMWAAGRGVPKSPEHRKKLSEANKGKKATDQQRARLSSINKGRKHTLDWTLKSAKAQSSLSDTDVMEMRSKYLQGETVSSH